jgi:hypothetical protein
MPSGAAQRYTEKDDLPSDSRTSREPADYRTAGMLVLGGHDDGGEGVGSQANAVVDVLGAVAAGCGSCFVADP